MTDNSLCNSCINSGCEFQSGIVRTECTFYMTPPHIETDNCGNYDILTKLPNNATNGDVIKAMFTDFESHLLLNVISKEWWNAPYKGESEDKA